MIKKLTDVDSQYPARLEGDTGWIITGIERIAMERAREEFRRSFTYRNLNDDQLRWIILEWEAMTGKLSIFIDPSEPHTPPKKEG